MNLRVEPILKLLTALVLIFAVVVILVAKFMDSDGQTFQVMSGLLMGFAGALLGWIKPPSVGTAVEPAPGTQKTTTVTETQKGPPVEAPKP